MQPEIGICAAVLHGGFNRVFSGECFGGLEFRPQANLKLLRRQIVEAEQGPQPRDLLKSSVTPCDKGAQGIPGGIHLQVRCKPRRHLPGVREYEDLASPKRCETACRYGTRGLDLYLFCNKGLKRLVAFGLVILNGRAAEARYLPAATAGNKLTPRLQAGVHIIVVICGRRRSIAAHVNNAHPRPVLVGIQSPGFEIIIGRLRHTCWIRLFEKHVQRKKRACLAPFHVQTATGFGPKRGRIIHVIGVSTRIRRSAEPAGVKLKHTRAAFTALTRLAVHLPANPAALSLGQFAALRIHADPQAR